MVWKPGQSWNPSGRPRKYPEPPPVMNIRDLYLKERLNDILSKGNKGPLLFQLDAMQNETLPIAFRCLVANNITPYYHPRLGIAA
jgi:hypothetical protein